MEAYQIIGIVGLLICFLIYILEVYDIRYKGKCILHAWEYRYELGDYFRFTNSFLENNRRYVCTKCKKNVKK
jgi:hypothetical protein